MQITDQQFIDAMELAVQEKGGGHIAPGSYWSPDPFGNSGGEAFCIVGYALFKIDEKLCPRDNKHMADTLLAAYGCSRPVAWAGYAAQHANDNRIPWHEVLKTFKWGLAHAGHYEDVGVFMHAAMDYTRREHALTQSKVPAYGVDKGVIHTFSGMTFDFIDTDMSAAFTTLTKAFNEFSVTTNSMTALSAGIPAGLIKPVTSVTTTKKAHALVA
jgi:hypothetical protein